MILEAQSLSKTYQQGSHSIEVFNGLNFQIEKGETVAVIGPSGSGKSTLLSLLAGLDQPSKGSVNIAGENISQMDQKSLTRFRGQHIGIIFQQFHLMNHLTALENVALPLEIAGDSEASSKAQQALSLVGLSHREKHTPSELSGGECQRVAIARAFVVKPALLLADEPSGNLDRKTGDQVMDQLFDMVESQKMTMVLVTHNQELAQRCHRSLQLEPAP